MGKFDEIQTWMRRKEGKKGEREKEKEKREGNNKLMSL